MLRTTEEPVRISLVRRKGTNLHTAIAQVRVLTAAERHRNASDVLLNALVLVELYQGDVLRSTFRKQKWKKHLTDESVAAGFPNSAEGGNVGRGVVTRIRILSTQLRIVAYRRI